MNARCVWAGRLVLRVMVSGGGWSTVLDLTLGTPVQIADGQLTLVSVTPEQMAGKRPRRVRPYRFLFEFMGGR